MNTGNNIVLVEIETNTFVNGNNWPLKEGQEVHEVRGVFVLGSDEDACEEFLGRKILPQRTIRAVAASLDECWAILDEFDAANPDLQSMQYIGER